MKVTFTLKDLSDMFYEGHGTTIVGFNSMEDRDKLTYLMQKSSSMPSNIKMKIGSGSQFKDRVELNQILRTNYSVVYSLEPRKGYKLATFEVTKG